ncbi:cupin domain-containing protein [Rhodococcus sp. NPDC080181]|uniref:cupin domain-containing protein n=1 Tax=Rhodococcus sp. NPDC080181 TaxID=3155292 RepID=UPI00344F9BE3
MLDVAIDLESVLAGIDDLWNPRIVAKVNDHEARVAKFHGEYIWHSHADTDELFLVLDGRLKIELLSEDGVQSAVELPRGSLFVVRRGRRHKPVSEGGASVLMLEYGGTITIGDEEDVPSHIPSTSGVPLASPDSSAQAQEG